MEYNRDTKTLTIDYDFNEELKDIPNDTQIIIFKNKNKFSKFNKKVDNLPKSLIKIFFGGYFNQKIDYLPQSLTHLSFGYCFNRKVNNFSEYFLGLPKNLSCLTFNDWFKQKINNFPKNLTQLNFGVLFNQKIDKLPKNLTNLTLSFYFNNKLNILSKELKYLKLGYKFTEEIILPKNLEEIILYSNNNLINNIPTHIKKIKIICNFEINIKNLPLTIEEIVIQHEDYKRMIKIPFGCILTVDQTILNL
jgi:hypothetical protein